MIKSLFLLLTLRFCILTGKMRKTLHKLPISSPKHRILFEFDSFHRLKNNLSGYHALRLFAALPAPRMIAADNPVIGQNRRSEEGDFIS